MSGIPEPPPLEQWVTTTDPATGVSFALPGDAEIKQGPGDAGTSTPPGTMYQVKLGKFGLTAVFGETTTTHSKEGLDQFVDTWDARFKSNGVDDGKVTNRQHTTVQDRPALDFQASFTAKTGVKNIWFVRVIGEQTRAIQLISMVFVEPGEETSAPAAVEKYHSQLLDSVRLP